MIEHHLNGGILIANHEQCLQSIHQEGNKHCWVYTAFNKVNPLDNYLPRSMWDVFFRVDYPWLYAIILTQATSSLRQSAPSYISQQLYFTTYKKREKRGRIRFYTDLTKRRLNLKKLADEKVKDNEKVKFAFADINNSIRLRLANEKMAFFNSEDELDKILDSL